jgi:mRNA interferase MazF
MTEPRCSQSPISWSSCVRRGDVHRLRIPKGVGHEQQGERYGVVVQADELLPRSVVLLAPTSRSARAASFRPQVLVAGDDTRVLVEHVGAVDVQRLGKRVGRLDADDMWAIDEALMTVLGLD